MVSIAIGANSPTSVVPIHSANNENARERFNNIIVALKSGRQIAVTVEATSYCNLACAFCGMHSASYDLDDDSQGRAPRKIRRYLHYPVFLSFLEKMTGMPPLKVLYFHGHGEPLLNKDLPQFIASAKDAKVAEHIAIVTNGTLLTGEELTGLVRVGVNEIRVSLDVMTPEVYLRVKGHDMGKRVVSNIVECLETIQRDRLGVRFTIDCMQWRDKESELYGENGLIESVFADIVARTPGACIRWRDEFGWVDQMGHRTPITLFPRTRPCEQAFYMLMVHSDGKVSACCADSSQTLIVGDMNDVDGFQEIFLGSKLQAVRRALLTGDFASIPQCKMCDVTSVVDQELQLGKDALLSVLDEIESRDASRLVTNDVQDMR